MLANAAHHTSWCVVTMPACITSWNMLVPLCSEYSSKDIYHLATQISQSRLVHSSTGIADALSSNLLTIHRHQQEICCAPAASGSSRVQRRCNPINISISETTLLPLHLPLPEASPKVPSCSCPCARPCTLGTPHAQRSAQGSLSCAPATT